MYIAAIRVGMTDRAKLPQNELFTCRLVSSPVESSIRSLIRRGVDLPFRVPAGAMQRMWFGEASSCID